MGSHGSDTPLTFVLAEARLGKVVAGRFVLDAIVGEGAMGVVYSAHDRETSEQVAVKFLKSEYAMQQVPLKRFLREAKMLSRLQHENAVRIMDSGCDANGAFLVMELLDGESLGDRLRREGRTRFRDTMEVVLPIMRALRAAHDLRIVHRDIKPDNVFLATKADGRVVPKLVDFGLAKLEDQSGTHMTATGAALGTPSFMAPEQANASREAGASADIWSVGVLLYRCLSGELPFPGETMMQIFMKLASTEAPPLHQYAPEYADTVAPIVHKCLQKEIADRYQSIQAVIDDLEALDWSAIERSEASPPHVEGVAVEVPRGGSALTPSEGTQHRALPAVRGNAQRGEFERTTERSRPLVEDRAAPRWPWLVGALLLVSAAVWAMLRTGAPQLAAVPSPTSRVPAVVESPRGVPSLAPGQDEAPEPLPPASAPEQDDAPVGVEVQSPASRPSLEAKALAKRGRRPVAPRPANTSVEAPKPRAPAQPLQTGAGAAPPLTEQF